MTRISPYTYGLLLLLMAGAASCIFPNEKVETDKGDGILKTRIANTSTELDKSFSANFDFGYGKLGMNAAKATSTWSILYVLAF